MLIRWGTLVIFQIYKNKNIYHSREKFEKEIKSIKELIDNKDIYQ
jgi:hypothetical protein